MPRRAGNDLNESITPVEAGLTWTIGKKRREACDFLGGEVGSPRFGMPWPWQAYFAAPCKGPAPSGGHGTPCSEGNHEDNHDKRPG